MRYTYKEAKEYLQDRFKREPTEEEIDKYYNWMTLDQ